jgi:hypothetical protein
MTVTASSKGCDLLSKQLTSGLIFIKEEVNAYHF